ncbi:hypothetical protein BJY59DRAFT_376522 [Rhodotorula toruloides]
MGAVVFVADGGYLGVRQLRARVIGAETQDVSLLPHQSRLLPQSEQRPKDRQDGQAHLCESVRLLSAACIFQTDDLHHRPQSTQARRADRPLRLANPLVPPLPSPASTVPRPSFRGAARTLACLLPRSDRVAAVDSGRCRRGERNLEVRRRY